MRIYMATVAEQLDNLSLQVACLDNALHLYSAPHVTRRVPNPENTSEKANRSRAT